MGYEELVIAVDLPTAVCNGVAQAQAALKRASNPLHMQWFWVPPNIAHVAVLYTGRVREDLVGQAVDAFRAATAQVEPFSLRLKGLKLYEEGAETQQEVKGIWAMVENTEPLQQLRDKLFEAVINLDLEIDDLPFYPHVTVALADQFRNTREFSAAWMEWQGKDFGDVAVQALLAKRTDPHQGSVDRPFAVVAHLPLTGRKEETTNG
jgi:2'-5' RNA ligase